MKCSVAIPVWNGAAVIGGCLDALLAQQGTALPEVVCVDNASVDGSAELIAGRYPWVRLLRQQVNLGFSGGVNAGLAAVEGDLLILLNQDCLVRAGWLAALQEAAAATPGVLGCTVYNADGSVDHRGARLSRPLAYGEHLTEPSQCAIRPVDYVTGAAMALTRAAWEATGALDEAFYPAYYEDVDYCYRARLRGFPVAWARDAEVDHLRSGREWIADAWRHWANQHRSRYRFVAKHWDDEELKAFFEAEQAAAATEKYSAQSLGRCLGARDTLRALPEIASRRLVDIERPRSQGKRSRRRAALDRIVALLAAVPRWRESAAGETEAPERRRLLQAGFTAVMQVSLGAVRMVSSADLPVTRGGEPVNVEQRCDDLERRIAVLEVLAKYDYR